MLAFTLIFLCFCIVCFNDFFTFTFFIYIFFLFFINRFRFILRYIFIIFLWFRFRFTLGLHSFCLIIILFLCYGFTFLFFDLYCSRFKLVFIRGLDNFIFLLNNVIILCLFIIKWIYFFILFIKLSGHYLLITLRAIFFFT